MPVINKFDGGIVTGVYKDYITPEFSTILVDANIERIGLNSAQEVSKIGKAKPYFYQYPVSEIYVRDPGGDNEEEIQRYKEPMEYHVTGSNIHRSYAEFEGRLCFSDGTQQCKMTDGIMNDLGLDFKWLDMGVAAPDGKIVARPITLTDDIPAGSAVIQLSGGHIQVEIIRYRLVDDTGRVYIHNIEDNTGNAKVTFTLPSTITVYREIIDNYGNNTDQFINVGSGDFTDGLNELARSYNFNEFDTLPNRASYRLCLNAGSVYSIPYSVTKKDGNTTITVSNSYKLSVENSWLPEYIGLSVTEKGSHNCMASGFVYAGSLYLMLKIGTLVKIYHPINGEVYSNSNGIGDAFFKCTTVEHGNKIYFFDTRRGKVLIFDGATLSWKTIDKFPYSTAEDTVITIRGDVVYALINNEHDANIRTWELPDFNYTTPNSYDGSQRVKLDRIRGLGGSSGCDFIYGDSQVFPVAKGLIMFSTITNQLSKSDVEEAGVTVGMRGFVFKDTYTLCINDDKILRWELITPIHDEALLFDERTLSGTMVYNVGQQTDSGVDGPIMLTESNPVEIFKGHMHVDLSGVTHTNELRLYRSGGYLTVFALVEDVDPGVLYIDSIDDVTAALGREGVYDQAYSPPEGLRWLTSHRGLLFGAVDNTLYWSQPGQADYWDEAINFLKLDRIVYGLVSGLSGLIIFMGDRINMLVGDDVETFALRTTTLDKGSKDSYGIQGALGGALFFSNDGLCFTDGITVKELSYKLLGDKKLSSMSSMVTSRSYYALLDNFMESEDNKIILRYEIDEEPTFSALNADKVHSIGTIDSKLAHTFDELLYDTLGGDEMREFHYKSGNIVEGMPTVVKEWDRIRVTGSFIGLFIVYVGGKSILSKHIDTINNKVNMHLQKGDNKGKSISFEAKGKGIIVSIEYSITQRGTTK